MGASEEPGLPGTYPGIRGECGSQNWVILSIFEKKTTCVFMNNNTLISKTTKIRLDIYRIVL